MYKIPQEKTLFFFKNDYSTTQEKQIHTSNTYNLNHHIIFVFIYLKQKFETIFPKLSQTFTK